MKTADRQKLCTTCDGRIPLEAIACPYCSAEQTAAVSDASKNAAIQESLSSLYTPPYSNKGLRYSIAEEPKIEAPAKARTEGYKEVKNIIKDPTPSIPAQHAAEAESEAQNHFWPTLMLSSASVIATVGLLQFFFSENGTLRLEWDSSYWFIYCLVSAPLFFFGIKKVNQLK